MKRFYCIVFFCIAIVLSARFSFSQEETRLLVKSKYFSLYGYRNLDIDSLLNKLYFNYFFQPDTVLQETAQDKKSILSKTLDSLFLEVSDILDIHLYSLHSTIKIYPGQNSINSEFNKFFETDFNERSFYLYEKNTIYISFSDLTLGMLGHEVAHAIISHYFVVPPPVTIQEVLAGYVEYNLRKSTGTLP